MKKEIPTQLSKDLMGKLEGEQLVLLATIEAEEPVPNVTAISWVKSVNEKKIRFAVTNQSRIIANIKNNERVVLTVVALETVYSIQGRAKILKDIMDGVPIKLSNVEVTIDAVFESMFWGAKITQEPLYEKIYNPKKAKELDDQVYNALL
jgi:uncharacterized pyridoxamine 5'-phosphate oxidase family protein